jgi:hypothetical protein
MGRPRVNREDIVKRLLIAVVVATACVGSGPTFAFADTATLDGVPVSEAEALAGDNPCVQAASGGLECYSSDEALSDAAATALENGELPPGYLAMPPEDRREEILDAHRANGSNPEQASRSALACPRDYTNFWTGGNWNDNHGSQGYTGLGDYRTFGGQVWDNDITSFKHGLYYTVYANRTDFVDEKYYGGQSLCSEVASLAGDYWNNRFGSVVVY